MGTSRRYWCLTGVLDAIRQVRDTPPQVAKCDGTEVISVQILCSRMQATTASVACKKHLLLADMDKDILFLGLALEGAGVLRTSPKQRSDPRNILCRCGIGAAHQASR